jgi:hypothetical protein
MQQMSVALVGAAAIAAVSTLGDYIWATLIPRHLPRYGLAHGAALFLSVGLYLGVLASRPGLGAAAGALIGLTAAGLFYVLAPVAGFSVMFFVWFGIWIALAFLDRRLLRGRTGMRETIVRGVAAAVLSGAAFYAVSGIWFPFRPRGWDYAVHFASWTVAYLPGFLALLVEPSRPAAPAPAG